jgi:hypothetical protein
MSLVEIRDFRITAKLDLPKGSFVRAGEVGGKHTKV